MFVIVRSEKGMICFSDLHLLCFFYFWGRGERRGEKQGAEEMGVLMCCGFLALGIDAMLSNIKVWLLNGFLLAYFFMIYWLIWIQK